MRVDALHNVLERRFTALGAFNGQRPCLVILLSILVSGACMAGFMNFITETRPDKLWSPQGTPSQNALEDYTTHWTGAPRLERIIATSASSGNVMSPDALAALAALHEQVLTLNVTVMGESWTFEKLCIRRGPQCQVATPISAWGSRAALLADADVVGTLHAAFSREDLDAMFGGTTDADDGSEKIASAKAVVSRYFVQNNDVLEGGSVEDVIGEAWEEAFLDLVLQRDGAPAPSAEWDAALSAHPFAQRTFSDEFGGAIRGDISLLSASYFILILYLVFNLGDGICNSRGCTRSRAALSFAAFLSIGLAIAASHGLAGAFGVPYGSLHSVLPFVILGIGVDDSFVLVNAWDDAPPLKRGSKRLSRAERNAEIAGRAARAMGHAGVSVTVTSVTDVTAFLLGSTSSIPALASFCLFAALAVLGVWLLQVTFFFSFIVLDERRIANGRRDCFCCCAGPSTDGEEEDDASGDVAPEYKRAPNRVSVFLEKGLTPAVLHPAGRASVIFVTLVTLGVGVAGILKLDVEATRSNFIPDDSYAKTTLDLESRYFNDGGSTVKIVTAGFDYFTEQAGSAAIEGVVSAAAGRVPSAALYLKGPGDPSYTNWVTAFNEWLRSPDNAAVLNTDLNADSKYVLKEERYYSLVKIWLASPAGGRYASDVVFDSKGEKIERTRIGLEHVQIGTYKDGEFKESTADEVGAMEAMTKLVAGLPVEAYVFSFAYTDWETYKIIETELLLNLVLALSCVFVISLALIGNLLTALLVFFCVLFTIVQLLGLMWVWGLAIDTVSVVNIVLAVGLSVDYAAHIGHCFMLKSGASNAERIIKSVGDIGGPVCNGAVSTFLAVMLLSISKSYVFRTLFKQFFGTVVFGVFNGLIVLPVMLFYVGPAPHSQHGRSSEQVQQEHSSPSSPAPLAGEQKGDADVELAKTVKGGELSGVSVVGVTVTVVGLVVGNEDNGAERPMFAEGKMSSRSDNLKDDSYA